MTKLESSVRQLVIANRILANEEVVDAYGHVSIRHPDNPSHFLLSRSLSPELVEAGDIMEFDLDGKPVGGDKRAPYSRDSFTPEFIRSAPRSTRWCTATPTPFCRSAYR